MPQSAKVPLVDRDRLNSAPAASVASTCVSIFDRIQGLTQEKQLLGLACAFALMCDAVNLPPQEVYQASRNVMAEKMTASGMKPQFEAMRFHLETDILTRD